MSKLTKITVSMVCAVAISGSAALAADDFPTRPITLIVPYGAGGATDAMFRGLAASTEAATSHTIVVENRAGGTGAVAAGSLLSRAPDGYTVMVTVAPIQRASFQAEFNFDVVNDLQQIIQVGGLQYGIVVSPDSEFETLEDLIEAARQRPGEVTYMSAGVGSGGHIYMSEIAQAVGGIEFNHIPAGSDAEAASGVLGGHVDAIAVTPGAWAGLVQAGELRLLATLGEERASRFPDSPTVLEAGIDVTHTTPLGLSTHHEVSRDVIEKLHDIFYAGMQEDSFQEVMDQQENAIMYLGPDDYAAAWAVSYEAERDRAEMLRD